MSNNNDHPTAGAAAGAQNPTAGEPKGDPGGNVFACIKECTFRLRRFGVGETFRSEPGEKIPEWFEKVKE